MHLCAICYVWFLLYDTIYNNIRVKGTCNMDNVPPYKSIDYMMQGL